MTRRLLGTVAMVLIGLVLMGAGCGGGGGGGGGAATVGTSPETGAEPGKLEGGKVAVNIKDLKFEPEELTVPSGATVVFTNEDHVPHTIKKARGPGPDFDSGPLESGATFSQVLNRNGTYRIVDPDRPTTEMTIKVVKGLVEEEP